VNRIFAKHAHKIALSFAETSGIELVDQNKTVFVGNPVRQEILALNQIPYSLPQEEKIVQKSDNRMGYKVILASDFEPNPPKNYDNLFNILVIGGSGGAKIFSEILPKAFFNFNDDLKGHISITQQCRSELAESTFDQYRAFNLNIEVQSFFADMPEKIKEAHLIIARSGSSSIFEFCAAKKPMILVPFEKSADNHQEKNARFLEKNGAAIVITEKDFTINNINKNLQNLINSYATLEKMSQASASLAEINATTNLAKLIQE
jgi:UDP-N-acetylglucosamine--N-acetylmuramyl-(pentapeptide) pyrophosphoryl-undecaprenol N-acetylglucosamine transferase